MLNKIYKQLVYILLSKLKNETKFMSEISEYTSGLIFAGNKQLEYQKFYYDMYLRSINGMNYGNGSFIEDSGEKKALEYVKSKLTSNNLILFDVGANIGKYTQELLSLFVDKKIQIHCFEPSFLTFKKLNENIKDHRVIINNLGISNSNTSVELHSNEDGSGLASIYDRKLDHFHLTLDKKETIKVVSIEHYCSENKIAHIDFLKLDIEGHEYEALLGAKDLIKNCKIKFIQFEFGGSNIDSKTFFQDFFYLVKDNYKIYRILCDGLFEITEYKETLEIFTTVNFLLELKKE